MPAVLRPTQYPSSVHSVKTSATGESDDEDRQIHSSSSFTSLFAISGLSKLSRKPTGDSAHAVDWDWDLANYPKVNGQPTRRHWKVRSDKKHARTRGESDCDMSQDLVSKP